jgi:membrane dipeptidase
MRRQQTHRFLARARDFLERNALVDAHNDLPYVIRRSAAKGDLADYRLDRAHQETDTDIPRLKAGRVAGQFWAAFVPTSVKNPATFTLEQIALIKRMNAAHPDVFLPALKPGDVSRARRQGRIASFICVESGVGLDNSLEVLALWHELGVRYLTLCHNETLDWVDSSTDAPRHGGLTGFGRSVILECNRLGILVDLSHTSHEAQLQALETTSVPLAITHANAFSLVDHPRNVRDEVLAGVRANGGVVCATFVPTFANQAVRDWIRPLCDPWGKPRSGLSSSAAHASRDGGAGPAPVATVEDVCDHIDYMTARLGIDHIGVGSDFYGGRNPDGLEDVSCFPNLIAALMARGWGEPALKKLVGGNLVRVLRAVEKAKG